MKKLMTFMLVFGMASMALATPYFAVDSADEKDDGVPSDIITINLIDNGQVIGFVIDAITDNAGGLALSSITSEPTYNSNWGSTNYPDTINSDGMLIEWAGASVTSTGAYVTGILYSFEYHMPDVPFSTCIIIQTYDDGGNNWLPAEVTYKDGSKYVGIIDGVVIHLVPEPATLALLGLGGLALLRKRRK